MYIQCTEQLGYWDTKITSWFRQERLIKVDAWFLWSNAFSFWHSGPQSSFDGSQMAAAAPAGIANVWIAWILFRGKQRRFPENGGRRPQSHIPQRLSSRVGSLSGRSSSRPKGRRDNDPTHAAELRGLGLTVPSSVWRMDPLPWLTCKGILRPHVSRPRC